VKSLGANPRIDAEPFAPKVVEHLDAKVRQQAYREMRNGKIADLWRNGISTLSRCRLSGDRICGTRLRLT
jgi:hypothetical protein